jgi:hypothetical protein
MNFDSFSSQASSIASSDDSFHTALSDIDDDEYLELSDKVAYIDG